MDDLTVYTLQVTGLMLIVFALGALLNPWGMGRISFLWSYITNEIFAQRWKELYDSTEEALEQEREKNEEFNRILVEHRMEGFKDAKEIGDLRNKVEEMHNEAIRGSNELNHLRGVLEHAHGDIKFYVKQVNDATIDHDKLVEQNKSQSEQLETVTNELKQTRYDLVASRKMNVNIAASHKEMRERTEQLHLKIAHLERDNAIFKEQVGHWFDESKDLTKKLNVALSNNKKPKPLKSNTKTKSYPAKGW